MNTDYETQIGGRLDNTCPQCRDILGEEEECVYGMTTCICRTVGEYCYSDFPVMYNIWFVSAIILQLWNGFYASKYAIEILKDKLNKKPEGVKIGQSKRRLTAMESIILLTWLGCVMRLLWTIAQVNGRHASVILDNIIVDSILLKAPQIFWLCSFIYTALVWKRLTDQSQTMTTTSKGSNKQNYKKLSFKVTMMNVLLLGLLLPAYIIGTIWYPFVAALVDYFFFLLSTIVAIQGYRFGSQLCEQLKRTSMGAFLAPTIMNSIYYASFAVAVVILYGVTYKTAFNDNNPDMGLIYAFVVHQLCETLVVYSLLLTKKNSEKEKQRRAEERKRAGTSFGATRSRATTGGNSDKMLRNINDSYASTIETTTTNSPDPEGRILSTKKKKPVDSGKSISFKTDKIVEEDTGDEKNMV